MHTGYYSSDVNPETLSIIIVIIQHWQGPFYCLIVALLLVL